MLNIADELKKLFTLFDPKAKKYREIEEKAVKQAELMGKPAATPARPYVGDSSAAPYSAPYSPTQPSYKPYGAPQTYTPPLRGRPTTPGRPFTKQEDADKKKTTTPSKKKNGEKEEEKKEKPFEFRAHTQLNKDIDAALSKIEGQLKEANDLISSNELVKKLDSALIDSSPVDMSLAVEILPDLNKALNIKKGVLGEMHQLHRKLKTAPNRQAVRKSLSDKYNKNKKELTALHEKLDTLSKEWDSKQQALPANKKYAYFGITDIEIATPEGATEEQLRAINTQKEQLELTKSKVFAPYSLFEINNLVKKIEKTIQDFAKEKLPEEK